MDRLSISERYHAEKPGPGFTARYTCPQNWMRSSGWISRRTGAASASRHQSRLMEGRLRRTCSSKYRVVFKPRLVLAGGRECAGRPRLVKAGRRRGKSRRPSPQRLHHHHLPHDLALRQEVEALVDLLELQRARSSAGRPAACRAGRGRRSAAYRAPARRCRCSCPSACAPRRRGSPATAPASGSAAAGRR